MMPGTESSAAIKDTKNDQGNKAVKYRKMKNGGLFKQAAARPLMPMPTIKKSAVLKELFDGIVNGKNIYLDIKSLENMITKDLNISLTELDPILLKVLPYMLVSYTKSWPGWIKNEEYVNGSLQMDNWFEKYIQYVTFKLRYLIEKEFQKALAELKTEEEKKKLLNVEIATQCSPIESRASRPFSAFEIEVKGPPKLLNTLLFSANQDDIHLRTHVVKPWVQDFGLKHLLNWPFLEIHFFSPYLTFTRKMEPEYMRYLARTDDTLLLRKQDFIKEVDVQAGVERVLYSVSFMRQYMEQYLRYLIAQNFSVSKIEEIILILTEFFRDISEVGAVCDNSIHNATRISFNIGGCRYVRNKKTASSSTPNDKDPAVGFCEVITPKCSIILEQTLKMGQLSTLEPSLPPSFFHLTEQGLQNQHNVHIEKMPSMMYSCNFCKKEYGGTFALTAVMNHFQVEHRMEHAIMCHDCQNVFDVKDLSETRWYHKCKNNSSSVNPTSVNLV